MRLSQYMTLWHQANSVTKRIVMLVAQSTTSDAVSSERHLLLLETLNIMVPAEFGMRVYEQTSLLIHHLSGDALAYVLQQDVPGWNTIPGYKGWIPQE